MSILEAETIYFKFLSRFNKFTLVCIISRALVILLFLIMVFGSYVFKYSYPQTLADDFVEISNEISVREFKVILDKVIIPDIDSRYNQFSLCKRIEIRNDPSSPDCGRFVIALEQKASTPPLQYQIYKKIWNFDGSTIKVFSIRRFENYCFALDESAIFYPLSAFPDCDFDKLVKYMLPGHLSGNSFRNLCLFYLTNVHAHGFDVKILDTIDALPFMANAKASKPFSGEMMIIRKTMTNILKTQFYKPVLESSEKGYHFSLIAFTNYDGSVIDWDFYISNDKKFETRKRVLFQSEYLKDY